MNPTCGDISIPVGRMEHLPARGEQERTACLAWKPSYSETRTSNTFGWTVLYTLLAPAYNESLTKLASSGPTKRSLSNKSHFTDRDLLWTSPGTTSQIKNLKLVILSLWKGRGGMLTNSSSQTITIGGTLTRVTPDLPVFYKIKL